MVGLLVACPLPVVIGGGYHAYLLRRELDIFLLEGLANLTQVDEEHFALAVAVVHLFAVLGLNTGFLVVVQYPERYADVGGVEHIARQDDDGLHLVVLDELAADGQLGAVGTQRTVGQQESGHTAGGEF